jgi:hypothetical protein
MTLTIEELKDKLQRIDEVTLLEILEINSELLVEAFEDRIIEQYDALAGDIEDDTSTWD